ncbi:DUF2637 domain-containing protein [Streptomyces buecherae]|uniref:DUF2637 domain-containing protein n=1 Tax=Streptomyces buecherae TaxID=2763006 RepID=UPI0027E25AF0|nr:DUF2637 domain-containing protein [Streptomyces buecherae]
MSTPKGLLIAALIGVVSMAFRVSWNALRDIAETVGADATAALLYPFVVDGLMALALVATLRLTGDDRRFALRVLATYTLASLALNYVHGLAQLDGASGDPTHLTAWSPANWALVLVATSLPVGAIFFGSDLVAKVLHHRPEAPDTDTRTVRRVHPDAGASAPAAPSPPPYAAYAQATARAPEPYAPRNASRTETVRPPRPPVRGVSPEAFAKAELQRARQRAEQAYADSLDAGRPIGPAALGREFGFSEGWGRKRIRAVEVRREVESNRLAAASS